MHVSKVVEYHRENCSGRLLFSAESGCAHGHSLQTAHHPLDPNNADGRNPGVDTNGRQWKAAGTHLPNASSTDETNQEADDQQVNQGT